MEKILTVGFPRNPLRIINHWDNVSGKKEWGYAGTQIFYRNNQIIKDTGRNTHFEGIEQAKRLLKNEVH